jgi:hypothetical protein
MVRILGVLAVSAVLGWAPLQCSGEPDPSLRRNETPDEALYALAHSFRQRGDAKAWRVTLEYLIERYPNGRFAVRAKEDLDRQR